MVGLLLSAHWFACIWAMQVSLAHETPVDSWMGWYGYCWDLGKSPDTSLERVVVDGPGVAEFECAAPGSRYSASVYFAVMTITSIGYGDIYYYADGAFGSSANYIHEIGRAHV